jgi:hypothetical protein
MRHSLDKRPRRLRIPWRAASLIAIVAILGSGMSPRFAQADLSLGRPNPEGTSI